MKRWMIGTMFILNGFGTIYLFGLSILVLFGDFIFSESVGESFEPYQPLFWILFLLSFPVFYYSLPKQGKKKQKNIAWLSLIVGLLCFGGIIHDLANGKAANGDNSLTILIPPAVIFIFTGLFLWFQNDRKKKK